MTKLIYNLLKPGLVETSHNVQVKSKLDSPENRAFQKCFAVLSDGIFDPGWLASELYSKDMISREVRQEVQLETLNAQTRTYKLLSAVEDQIIASPASKFKDFLYILHSESSCEHLAKELEETYKNV